MACDTSHFGVHNVSETTAAVHRRHHSVIFKMFEHTRKDYGIPCTLCWQYHSWISWFLNASHISTV